jgi:hypothetical protein
MRLCERPGCNAEAAATFTFSSAHGIVWLDRIGSAPGAAGRLCARHADSLVPPRGWQLHDRRAPDPADLLDARSPLLARAFRGARAS